MDQLIVDLMTYTRVGRGDLKRSRVDMGRVLNAAINDLKEDIEKQGASITLSTRPFPSSWDIYDTLVHVVHQLLSNAILSTRRPVGSPGLTGSSRAIVEYSGGSGSRTMGLAFPRNSRMSGFSAFVDRLHGVEAYPGSGLGLAIARRGCEESWGGVRCGVRTRSR
jgi:signal transduction histidine kinase